MSAPPAAPRPQPTLTILDREFRSTLAALRDANRRVDDPRASRAARTRAGEDSDEFCYIANDTARAIQACHAATYDDIIVKLRALLWHEDLPDAGDIELRKRHIGDDYTLSLDPSEAFCGALLSLAKDLRRLDLARAPK